MSRAMFGKKSKSLGLRYHLFAHLINDTRYQGEDAGKGEKQAVFTPLLSRGGQYEVRMAYTTGGNRASNVPVTIDHQDGRATVLVNQSQFLLQVNF